MPVQGTENQGVQAGEEPRDRGAPALPPHLDVRMVRRGGRSGEMSTETARLKRHGRRAWSVVTLGLRTSVRSISQEVEHNAEGTLTLIKLLELSGTV